MDVFLLALACLALVAVASLLRRGGARPTQSTTSAEVCRQHVELFQGGQLCEAAVEKAKVELCRLLSRGDSARLEASLKPGTHFAVQVRALVELGTTEAGNILERQLQRRLVDDPVEQAWYRLDVAHGLRKLDRGQCMPALFCCFGTGDAPLAHLLAAEIICFPGFRRYLRQPEEAMGRQALRVLHQALVGLRSGVQPQVIGQARVAEAIETVWANGRDAVDPLAVRVFVEADRLLHRAEHAEKSLADQADQNAFNEQIQRLADIADALADFLTEAPRMLLAEVPQAKGQRQADLLHALLDLKADTAHVVVPLLEVGTSVAYEPALESLAWTHDARVGLWLCKSLARRIGRRGRASTTFQLGVLKVLKHFPSDESEQVLVQAATGKSMEARIVALGSLGWWEPVQRRQVLACLQAARRDSHVDVRRAAEAALARLGERQALQWFRRQLAGEHTTPIHEAIQLAADEGILLLWPDLDCLADADDGDVAYHACEALEQLRESCTFSALSR